MALVPGFETAWWENSDPSGGIIALRIWHGFMPMVVCSAVRTSRVGRLPASLAAIATLPAPFVGGSSAIPLPGAPASWQKGLALALVLGSLALGFLRRPRFSAGAE